MHVIDVMPERRQLCDVANAPAPINPTAFTLVQYNKQAQQGRHGGCIRRHLGYNADEMKRAHATTVAALLLFVVLSLVFTYPLASRVADAVEDRQDALLNVWITAWDGHQLLTDPVHLFDANIFYPYRRTLAYSELLLGNALLALPITAVSSNPVLGYNVALLLSFTLSGLGTYLLVRKLTGHPGAGVVAGLVFAFSSYQMSNLAQAQLLATQWLPFTLLALHLLLRQPRPRYAAAFVLFFWLQTVTSFYYGIMLGLVVVGFWILDSGFWIFRRRREFSWQLVVRHAPLRYWLAAVGCWLLLILPFVVPYLQVQGELGFERTLADSEPFSASLQQYALVPPGSVVNGQWLPSDSQPRAGGYPVDALFPGLVALGLAVWGLVRGRGRTRWLYAGLLLVAFCLSLGPRLYLAPGRPAGLDLPLPYAWLYAVVPGFAALRAPVRFDALVMLALAVLAGYGVASLLPQRRSGQPGSLVPLSGKHFGTVALLAGLVTLESLVWPGAHAEQVAVGEQVPQVYRWLAEQPPGPLLELPMVLTDGGPQLEYQHLSTYHWHPTPDGYSGFIPPKHGQIVYEMERFPSERSVSLLQALDVQYVVVHTARYSELRRRQVEAALAQASELTLLESFGADQAYIIERRSFDPGDLQVRAYLPARAIAGEPYTAYVIAVNKGPRSYAIDPTMRIDPVIRFEKAEASTVTDIAADVPLVISPSGGTAVIPLLLTLPAEPGSYRLVIGEQDGILGGWADEGTVEVGDQADSAFPVPVRLEALAGPATARPGDALPLSLTWRALGKIDAYYSVYVKLLDAQGNVVAGWDGQPQNGRAPTLTWVPGETVTDTISLPIPAGTSPGEYTVEVGMYRAEDLARCLLLDADGGLLDRVVLQVRIEP